MVVGSLAFEVGRLYWGLAHAALASVAETPVMITFHSSSPYLGRSARFQSG